jgi:hypothetical protein
MIFIILLSFAPDAPFSLGLDSNDLKFQQSILSLAKLSAITISYNNKFIRLSKLNYKRIFLLLVIHFLRILLFWTVFFGFGLNFLSNSIRLIFFLHFVSYFVFLFISFYTIMFILFSTIFLLIIFNFLVYSLKNIGFILDDSYIFLD